MAHPRTSPGFRRIPSRVDREVRAALEAVTAPDNYDPDVFAFDQQGRLTVRAEWLRETVLAVLVEQGLVSSSSLSTLPITELG